MTPAQKLKADIMDYLSRGGEITRYPILTDDDRLAMRVIKANKARGKGGWREISRQAHCSVDRCKELWALMQKNPRSKAGQVGEKESHV
jgi:ribonuclease HI